MLLPSCRLLAFLLPLTLTACASPDPAAASVPATASDSIGLDLGSSTASTPSRTLPAGEGHERPLPGVAEYQIAHAGHEDAHATGTVNAVDAAQHKLTISHNPIPAIGWPAMTMEFPVAPAIDLQSIKPGSRVDFTIEKGKDGMYQVESLQPASQTR